MFGIIGLSYLLLCDNTIHSLAYTGKVCTVDVLYECTYLPHYVTYGIRVYVT